MSRTELSKLFAKALGEPGFRDALVRVAEVKAARPTRRCRCVVVEVPETARADDFADVSPGTVAAFVGREGEPLLRKLAKAVKADDRSAFASAAAPIRQMGEGFSRTVARADSYADSQRQDFPSLVEISYGDKTLVGHVHHDAVLPIQVHAFPYNGGYLDRKGFSLVEYYEPGTDTPLTCVLAVRRPELSDIELEALRLVPRRSSVNNLAAAPVAPLTPALMAFFAVAAEAAARWLYNEFVNWYVCLLHGCDTILTAIPDAVLEGEDFQNLLKSLPPEVTAAELLRLRTELLLRPPK